MKTLAQQFAESCQNAMWQPSKDAWSIRRVAFDSLAHGGVKMTLDFIDHSHATVHIGADHNTPTFFVTVAGKEVLTAQQQ